MSSVKVFYEPSAKLLTVFWKEPAQNQISSELGDGIIQIKDEETGEPIGLEFLSYQPGDSRLGIITFTAAKLNDGSYIPASSIGGKLRQIIEDLVWSSEQMDDFALEFHRLSPDAATGG